MPSLTWVKMKHAPSHRLFNWVVMKLIKPYVGKGNVTIDNFFTSYGLAKQLLQMTSIVGTVNKFQRELPPSAKTTQATRYLSVLLKAGDVAKLTIYQCKPKKNVCS